MDWGKYGRAFFWHAPNPTSFDAFKLPFADITDGKLAVVPRALSAVSAAVNGARGGVDGLSPADAKTIRSKVAAYQSKINTKKAVA